MTHTHTHAPLQVCSPFGATVKTELGTSSISDKTTPTSRYSLAGHVGLKPFLLVVRRAKVTNRIAIRGRSSEEMNDQTRAAGALYECVYVCVYANCTYMCGCQGGNVSESQNKTM